MISTRSLEKIYDYVINSKSTFSLNDLINLGFNY